MMVKVPILGLMKESTLESGRMTKDMVKVPLLVLMEEAKSKYGRIKSNNDKYLSIKFNSK